MSEQQATIFEPIGGPRVRIRPELVEDIKALIGYWIVGCQMARQGVQASADQDRTKFSENAHVYWDHAQSHLAQLLSTMTHGLDIPRLALARHIIADQAREPVRRRNALRRTKRRLQNSVPSIPDLRGGAGSDPGADRPSGPVGPPAALPPHQPGSVEESVPGGRGRKRE